MTKSHHTCYAQKDLIPITLSRDGVERLKYPEVLQALNHKDHMDEVA
jgi:hypothetical protein